MSSSDKNCSRTKSKTSSSKQSGRSQSSTASTSSAFRPPSSRNTKSSNIGSKKSDNSTTVHKQNLTKKTNYKNNISDVVDDEKDLNEMATTNYSQDSILLKTQNSESEEQETDVDKSREDESTGLLSELSSEAETSKTPTNDPINDNLVPLPNGWEEHTDKLGQYFWHVSSGVIQRQRPTTELSPKKDCTVFYHDDEEINQAQKTSSDDDDYYESGAALTIDDTSESTFVVYPLGCCEFDETKLVSIASTKAIQKCILRLSNKPTAEETVCWGLDQSQPVLMRLFGDHIQFTDIKTRTLLRSQPIQTIKTWAVDDDNNFAFVIEDRAQHQVASDSNYYEAADYALLNEPLLVCYVFRSMDDDDMSCKVAAKLNDYINRYKEQLTDRITRSTRMQQMIEQPNDDPTDIEDFDELEATNELTMNVKYIGKTPVPRPTGIDVLNVAIDKCLAEASKVHMSRQLEEKTDLGCSEIPPLTEAKLHVSPSSVIVENVLTGEITVECRIRYLTFMGISKRDIRWCGFIMQNPTNKTFVAHCFECHPTAGHVCEAIQLSCARMYEKVVKNSRQPETTSIIPTSSIIRNTLVKTFSRIKLKPIN